MFVNRQAELAGAQLVDLDRLDADLKAVLANLMEREGA